MSGDGINKCRQHNAVQDVGSHLRSLRNGSRDDGDACFSQDQKLLATTRQLSARQEDKVMAVLLLNVQVAQKQNCMNQKP
jgi:hypothetical protein